MRRTLRLALDRYWLSVPPDDVPEGPAGATAASTTEPLPANVGEAVRVEPADEVEARTFLRGLRGDADALARIRAALADEGGAAHVERLTDDAVVEQAAWRIAEGRWLLHLLVPRPIASPILPNEPPPPPPPPPPPKKQRTWVEIVVVHDQSGKPVPNVAIEVRTPDGGEVRSVTDAAGKIRIDQLDPGNCEAWCELENARAEDTLDFVNVGGAAGECDVRVVRPGKPATDPKPVRIARVEVHKVKTGETLDGLAKSAGLTWQALAEFNWGTRSPDKINGHLRDEVGCTKKTADGANYVFTDDDHPGIVLVPRPWEERTLPTTRTHVVRVRRLDRGPEPEIWFEKLDKWFVPGHESLDVQYSLRGVKAVADKVSMEVRASNYCDASMDEDGVYTFAPIADPEPVYGVPMPAAKCEPGDTAKHDAGGWKGETTTTKGMLKPRAGGKRYVDVAFSPYTVHLRFHKDAADAKARIELLDFWPRWKKPSEGGAVEADSLKVRWKVRECTKLKRGWIRIVDKADAVVFTKPLLPSDLTQGDHEFSWDGKLDDGTLLDQAKMPYRAQVSGHSDYTDDKGVACAALHTEVRLFVDPSTGTHEPAEPWKDKASLVLSLAPFAPKAPPDTDEDRWYQWKLAEGGFHPGPVDGTLGAPAEMALREFQRSVPAADGAAFKRLDPTGAKDADTKTVLATLAAETRPLFGNAATRADLSRADAEPLLKDPAKDLVVWVDDRHYYTEAKAGVMFLGDYRGPFNNGDGRVASDAGSISRPFVPVRVDFKLRPKDADKAGLASDKCREPDDTTRAAIGPVRVDWSFFDLPPDHTVIDTAHANYAASAQFIRSRTFVDTTVEGKAVTVDGRKYVNCLEDDGGIRPDPVDTYYREALAYDDDSLVPWRAHDDAAAKAVFSLVYDECGQPDDRYHAACVGRAGAYLHPSRIAGDGYRYRARASFDAIPAAAGAFPNQEVLERRYPKLPDAHTAALRLWRKTSFRGYSCWAPAAASRWSTFRDPCAAFYRGAYLHFVHEGGAPSQFALAGLVTAAEYDAAVSSNVTDAAYSGLTITFDAESVWPYGTEPRLGILVSPPGTTLNSFYDDVVNPLLDETWRKFRYDLIHVLLRKVETSRGLLKGHYLVEFRASAAMTVDEYRCSTCAQTRVQVRNNLAPADTLVGKPCGIGGCAGTWAWTTGTVYADGVPLPAVGASMGATWLFTSGEADVWAHEVGHHRHLEHAQANSTGNSVAPGAKNDQHDSAANTTIAGATALTYGGTWAAAAAKDKGWDRACVMSYNQRDKLYFCGRCLLKNRGWAVEGLALPAGNVTD